MKKTDKPAPLEKNVQKAILKWLNSLPECRAKNVSGDHRQQGEPDIDGCLKGAALKLEVKRPGNNRVTRLQQVTLSEWAAAGAITGVVHSVDETAETIAACRPDLVCW